MCRLRNTAPSLQRSFLVEVSLMHPSLLFLFDSEGAVLGDRGEVGSTPMRRLEQSNCIMEAIFARGRELSCRPLSVVVVEPGAKVKAFQKEDGSAMMRFEMAYGKAYAALALGRSSSLVRVRTEERPL